MITERQMNEAALKYIKGKNDSSCKLHPILTFKAILDFKAGADWAVQEMEKRQKHNIEQVNHTNYLTDEFPE